MSTPKNPTYNLFSEDMIKEIKEDQRKHLQHPKYEMDALRCYVLPKLAMRFLAKVNIGCFTQAA
jgi:hypothetical protein